MRATVLVRPKDGILDPQGQALEASLRQLGFDVAHARLGRVVDLELDATDPQTARAHSASRSSCDPGNTSTPTRGCGELIARA